MSLSGLDNSDLKFILFGGKGGVGKTSFATATAISLAETFKTLIISIDPAHSTFDSFGQQSTKGIQLVSGVENLSLIEINAEDVYDKFKKENEEELKTFLKPQHPLMSKILTICQDCLYLVLMR
jgi:arsenite-transporting ATPase